MMESISHNCQEVFRKARLVVFVRVGITIYVFWNDAPKIRLLTHANCRSGILTFPLCANAEHAAPHVDGIHILEKQQLQLQAS
jgi:hypothetical protein